METALLVTESTLTDRYQTTVPDVVRKALQLSKREKIRYTIQPDGSVILSRADEAQPDPALSHFLTFLANDIRKNPQHLQAATPELAQRIQSLVGEIDVDLNAPLAEEDD